MIWHKYCLADTDVFLNLDLESAMYHTHTDGSVVYKLVLKHWLFWIKITSPYSLSFSSSLRSGATALSLSLSSSFSSVGRWWGQRPPRWRWGRCAIARREAAVNWGGWRGSRAWSWPGSVPGGHAAGLLHWLPFWQRPFARLLRCPSLLLFSFDRIPVTK